MGWMKRHYFLLLSFEILVGSHVCHAIGTTPFSFFSSLTAKAAESECIQWCLYLFQVSNLNILEGLTSYHQWTE